MTIASSFADGMNGLAFPIVTVAVVSSLSTMVGAFATTLQMWLLYAGFVISHAGQVVLNETSASAALVLAGTAMGATAVGAAIRWIQMPVLREAAPHLHIVTSV